MLEWEEYRVMLIGIRQQLSELQQINKSVSNSEIHASSNVKNLGCWFDSNLQMSEHITKTCKACFFHLHNIRRIEKHLSRDCLFLWSWFMHLSPAIWTIAIVYFTAFPRNKYPNSSAFKMLQPDWLWIYGNMLILRPFYLNYIGFQSTQEYNLKCYCSLLKLFTTWRLHTSKTSSKLNRNFHIVFDLTAVFC
jgi:hypothetical protein